jgi:thiol:disulfide interchange protein DsbD
MSASFIWLAAMTGALSLLTPCVFPMIPITVAYFNQQRSRGWSHAMRHALLFSGGIVVTFTALGLGLAVLVGAGSLSRFAADPWVNIIIGVSFIAFALSLLGLYDVPLPFSNRFLNQVDSSAREKSGRAAGSVLMGFAFTLASFTCTAPFVGPLLVSASRGDWQVPLVGMAVFSTVFAAPFFLLAMVPRWSTSLPRAGVWLRDVKILVGLFEIAAALKFFSNADLVWGTNYISRSTVLIAWMVIALIAAGFLIWRIATSSSRPAYRWVAPAFAVAIAVWLSVGVRGRSLGEVEAFLPPSDVPMFVAGENAPDLQWILNDHRKALASASATNRLVFIDFTGYTCTNCRWMEANMFARPDVSDALSHFVLSRLYTDGEGELYENQQKFQEERFGTIALPLYAIVDGQGRTVRTFSGLTRSPAAFIAFLRQTS